MTLTWYVAYEVPKTVKQRGRRTPRATEMFEDESQAREFARKKAAEGLLVNAGTLNPHLPKRAIASGDIQRWIEGARQRPVSNSMNPPVHIRSGVDRSLLPLQDDAAPVRRHRPE
jgi:hypothetical protein